MLSRAESLSMESLVKESPRILIQVQNDKSRREFKGEKQQRSRAKDSAASGSGHKLLSRVESLSLENLVKKKKIRIQSQFVKSRRKYIYINHLCVINLCESWKIFRACF